MTEKNKQIYRLGQVYGYICQKHTRWSNIGHDTQAARTPLQGVTVALFAAIHAEAVNVNDDYIALRMDSVSPEIGDIECCSIDNQGIFTLGKMQINRDVKSLIDRTGMTQAEIAEKLGVKPLTVGRWYRGETPLPERARFDIENILLDK